MMRRISFALGVLAGLSVVRARLGRKSAERLAAATLETLLNAIEANDAQTGLHVRRVATYSLILAEEMRLDERDRKSVERVALFHDIGKVYEALFDIIHEPTSLTARERRAIATHPARGAEVLAPLATFYPELPHAVLAHHERWDGTGYPRGLRGTEIPLAARIVALADTFDAVAHDRHYRKGAGIVKAERVIAAGRGTQFDPDLVDLLLLPPVRQRLLRARVTPRFTRRPGAPERRDAREPASAPDVSFRWRSESLGDEPPPRASREASETRG